MDGVIRNRLDVRSKPIKALFVSMSKKLNSHSLVLRLAPATDSSMI